MTPVTGIYCVEIRQERQQCFHRVVFVYFSRRCSCQHMTRAKTAADERIKQKTEDPHANFSLSPPNLLCFQGRQGPKGEPGDAGQPGRLVSISPPPPPSPPLPPSPTPPPPSHSAVCEQETRDHPQSAALLLEPRFGRRCKIETTLGVGGFPCHPQGDPHSLLEPLTDKRWKASEAARIVMEHRRGLPTGETGNGTCSFAAM